MIHKKVFKSNKNISCIGIGALHFGNFTNKEDAKKMLEALEQKEKELQEKLQKKKVKGQRVKVLKDW